MYIYYLRVTGNGTDNSIILRICFIYILLDIYQVYYDKKVVLNLAIVSISDKQLDIYLIFYDLNSLQYL